MNKTLLTILSSALIATSAGAQTISSTELGTAQINTTVSELATTLRETPSQRIASNQKLVGINGSETPVGISGFPDVVDASRIMSRLTTELENYKGFKVVGMRFAVSASLGKNACLFAMIPDGDGYLENIAKKVLVRYDISDVDLQNKTVNAKWNETMFDEPYTITGEEQRLYYGYQYTQYTDKSTIDAYPTIYGKTDNYENGWLTYGSFSSKLGIYRNSSEKQPYCPCFQLILEDPNGEVSIVGINGSTNPETSTFYTLDGKKLNKCQKGMNIVKMSDGTTRKVISVK